jgi:hypothetical protein
MCCKYSVEKTKELKNIKRKRIRAYKILLFNNISGTLSSCYFNHHKWQDGKNFSDREFSEISNIDDVITIRDSNDNIVGANIYHGIHVYLKPSSFNVIDDARVVVRVNCKIEDLVCVGEDDTAVFMKVSLPKSEIERVKNVSKIF